MDIKKGKDHWAFLEDIEAPMWVDLSLKSVLSYNEIDDQWFGTSHLFHQCSSRQLNSTIFQPFEGNTTLEFEIEGTSSPKIPGSVSRSRGKHYRIKEWTRDDGAPLFNRKDPLKNLKGKPSLVGLGNSRKMQPKSSFVNAKGILGNLKTRKCLINKKDLANNAGANGKKPMLFHGDLKTSSFYMSDEVAESDASAVTYENSQKQQQKFLEVSSQTFDQAYTRSLLLAVRNSLGKSCISVKPSRFLVNNERVQSGDQPSSSSNSNIRSSLTTSSGDHRSTSSKSIVQSTLNPVFSVKTSASTSVCEKEVTPCSNNIVKMTLSAKNKVKDSSAFSASTFCINEGISGFRRGNTCNVRNPLHLEAAKSKVHYQNPTAKVSMPLGVKKECLPNGAKNTKEKLRVNRPNGFEGLGKENATRRSLMIKRCNGGGNSAGAIVVGKRPDPKLSLRNDGTRLTGPKLSNQSEDTAGSNAMLKFYPR